MPNEFRHAPVKFNTEFEAIAAGDINVKGLPAGSAGSRRIGRSVLSSIAALFTVSPDVAAYVRPATLSIRIAP
jgi:hypothetical protein